MFRRSVSRIESYVPWLFSSLLVLFVGCENTLRLANEPLPNQTLQASTSVERYSYNWPVGKDRPRSFELVLGSPIPLSPALKESAAKFSDSKPFGKEYKELVVPDGLEPRFLGLVVPIMNPNASLRSLGSIPLEDNKAVFAMSRDGDRIALFSRRGLEIWDVNSGQLIKSLKSKIGNLESLSFDCEGRHLFVANSTSVIRIDIEADRIDSVYSDFPGPIVQMVAALNVNKLVIRSKNGEVFVADESLANVKQLPGVISSSEISLSPAGDRIVFWNQDTPTQVSLVGLELGLKLIVTDAKFRGGNRLLACGANSNQWICGRECIIAKNTMSRTSTSGLQTERQDLIWDPVQLIVTSPWPNADQRLIVASRKNMANESELVLCDLDMRFLRTSYRDVLPRGAKSVVCNRTAEYVAFQVGNEILLYTRLRFVTSDLEDFLVEAVSLSKDSVSERLDLIGEFILKNDIWWHYGYSSHDTFTHLAMYIGRLWNNFESEESPGENSEAILKSLNQWLDGKSDLALLSSAFRRYYAALKLVMVRRLDRLYPNDRRQFDKHVADMLDDIQSVISKGSASSAAYVLLLFHTFITDFDREKVGSILERSAIEHPGSFEPYLMVARLLNQRLKGKQNDVSLFARALRDLYGGEFGDMLYFRICVAHSSLDETNWDRSNLMDADRLRPDLLLNGLQAYATNAIISESHFMGAFRLLLPADNLDDRYSQIMRSYYDRYLFAPVERVLPLSIEGRVMVDTPRYQVLRYIALVNGEEPPVAWRP